MLQPPAPVTDPRRSRRIAIAVALILLASAGIRLWQLATPAELMFDEVYYAKDAKAIVDGRVGPQPPLRWEAGDEVSWPHPEMGKFAIAAGIVLFGDRAFGWRIPAVVAGMVLLSCVYPIARRLGLTPEWSLIALLLAAADTLGIAQSRIATLDVFVAAWSLLCILLALRYVQSGGRQRWLWLCGAAGGMALGTKWSGALALAAAAAILLYCRMRDRRAGVTPARGPTPATLAALAALVLLPLGIYLLSYIQYFAAGHTPADWIELQRQALHFNLHLDATHSYASVAPSWIIDLRPVWYYFNSADGVYRGVVAMGNPFLWWSATLALLATLIPVVRHRATALLPTAILVAILYVPWFAATRTSFLYYMTPVAPLLAILVAAALAAMAGTATLPRRGIAVLAVTAALTALLWDPVGRTCAWVFWGLPGRLGPTFSWVGLALGLGLAAAGVAILSSPRLRAARPWLVMGLAGCITGIVVAFIPVVLNIPISPDHFSRIMWFRSWI